MSKIIFILPENTNFSVKKIINIFIEKSKLYSCYARMSENMSVRESKQEIAPKENVELRSLPTRKYLDETVIPLLLEGLSILTKVSYLLVRITLSVKYMIIDNGYMLNNDNYHVFRSGHLLRKKRSSG